MAAPNPPVLVSPIDASTVIGNALVFSFTVPTDADNNKLVFRAELDTISPIDSSHTNYMKYESRLSADNKVQGQWQVYNGTWQLLPTGGIGSSYYGMTARVTILKQHVEKYPNIKTLWYWQMSVSDQLGLNPIYNQVIYAQAIFG